MSANKGSTAKLKGTTRQNSLGTCDLDDLCTTEILTNIITIPNLSIRQIKLINSSN